MKVAVLGASKNRDRFSNRAIHDLLANNHEVIPIHPTEKEIEGLKVVPSLEQLKGPIDTLTVYVVPQHIGPLIDAIVQLRPRRVILNPGAESFELKTRLEAEKIYVLEACTLVMLRTRQF